MDYQIAIEFKGDVKKALDSAQTVLMTNGLEVTERSRISLKASNPSAMMNNHQNMLRAVSDIEIYLQDEELLLDADLGGMKTLARFLYWMPACFAVFFIVLFSVLNRGNGIGWVLWVSLLPMAPWVVLSPLLVRKMRGQTRRSLDVLLKNAATAGETVT